MYRILSHRFVSLGRAVLQRFQEFAIHPDRVEERNPSRDSGSPTALTASTLEIVRVFVVQSRLFEQIQVGG